MHNNVPYRMYGYLLRRGDDINNISFSLSLSSSRHGRFLYPVIIY